MGEDEFFSGMFEPVNDWVPASRLRSLEEENVRLRGVKDAAVRVANAEDWRSGAEWDEALAALVESLAALEGSE